MQIINNKLVALHQQLLTTLFLSMETKLTVRTYQNNLIEQKVITKVPRILPAVQISLLIK